MRKGFSNESGFTLFELIMVVVILAFLGVLAIPNFVDFEPGARAANEIGVAGGVQSAITTYFMNPAKGNRQNFPTALDGASDAACSASNICFNTVLVQGGIMSDWQKVSSTTYRSPGNATNVWTYDSDNGSFMKTTP